jgi:hypothetical protein
VSSIAAVSLDPVLAELHILSVTTIHVFETIMKSYCLSVFDVVPLIGLIPRA